MKDIVTGKEIVIEQFMALIKQQALICYRKLPCPKAHEVEDLMSEGCVVFCQTLDRYDPARNCKFITSFYTNLWQHFAGILKAAYRRHTGEVRQQVDVHDHEPADRSVPDLPFTSDLFTGLSRTAFLLTRELMEPTAKTSRNPFIARREAFERLNVPVEQRGTILNEIRSAMSRAMCG